MTTDNDELPDRALIFGKQIYTQGVFPVGFQDPSGTFPKVEYAYKSTVNRAARNQKRNDITTNGGIPTLPQNSTPTEKKLPIYPYNQVFETAGGHILELDDTMGNERILIRHQTGAGIEIAPDGTVKISSGGDTHIMTGADQHVVVEGNAHMTYQGDLNVDVAGDYNLTCGNFNQLINGDKIQQVDGAKRVTVEKNFGETVKGEYSTTIAKSKAEMVLGGQTTAVKGEFELAVDGNMGLFASGSQRITAEVGQRLTSDNTNIVANDISVFGHKGTIGGEEIIMYAHNLHAGHTLWVGDGEGGAGTINVDTIRAVDIITENTVSAPTFIGDLNGMAKTAATSVHQSYPDGTASPSVYVPSVGTQGTITENTPDPVSDDLKATALPTLSVASTYTKGNFGIQKVKIDPNDAMLEGLNRETATGGVTKRQLTAEEVRSKMRENRTLNNTDFTATQIAEGKLSEKYSSPNPSKIGRSASSSPTIGENSIPFDGS
tara:strand:+ start:6766 stop:8235 length:1470 start_codon:yes stop_codon:yes gene_type:complete